METDDGALVVQSTMAGTLTGMWRSVEATGQRVTHAACSIFRFNEDRLIVSEEMYADALTIMSQLGVLLPS